MSSQPCRGGGGEGGHHFQPALQHNGNTMGVCRDFEAGRSPPTTSSSTRLWVEDGEQQVIVGLEQCLQLRGHQRRLQEGDVHPLRARLAVRGGDGEGTADEAEARDGEADLVDLRGGKASMARRPGGSFLGNVRRCFGCQRLRCCRIR